MARPKDLEFVVIGLGRFGSSVAITLVQRGYTVLGIDSDLDITQRLSETLTHTVSLDATDDASLKAVDIGSFDTAIVAIGTNFESSVLCTVALKTLGVKTVVCKAVSQRQASILKAVGADRVVLPEHEAGERLARSLEFVSVADWMDVGAYNRVAEVVVPAVYAGQTLRDIDLLGSFGLRALVHRRGETITIPPPMDQPLDEHSRLVVFGAAERIVKFAEKT